MGVNTYIFTTIKYNKMNVQTLLLSVQTISATTSCKVENAQLTLDKLNEMLSNKKMPQRLIKRAIKLQEKNLKSLQ